MADPYKVLGVSPTADDSEIKSAYKKLVRKYHPDRFQDDTMAELAKEKMSEINSAYDQIMDDRKNGIPYSGSSSSYGSRREYRRYEREAYESGGRKFADIDYKEIRNLIHSGNLTQADIALNKVPDDSRAAEWYFLKGTISYQRGWLNDAYNHIARATQMDPGNQEYLSALQQMNRQRSGYMNRNDGFAPASSVGVCDCMSNLCLADCCCEMMGGDLIPCC